MTKRQGWTGAFTMSSTYIFKSIIPITLAVLITNSTFTYFVQNSNDTGSWDTLDEDPWGITEINEGNWEIVSSRSHHQVRGATLDILEHGDDGIIIEVCMNRFNIEIGCQGEYATISVPKPMANGLDWTTRSIDGLGIPELHTHIAVPLDCEASLVSSEAEDAFHLSLEGGASSDERPHGRGPIEVGIIDGYEVDASQSHPDELIWIGQSGILRDFNVVEIVLSPVLTDGDLIKVSPKIKVELSWESSDGIDKNIWSTGPVSKEFTGIYRESIANFGEISGDLMATGSEDTRSTPRAVTIPADLQSHSNRAEYMLIVNRSFFQGSLPLATHRLARFEVCVVNDTSIYCAFPHQDRSVSIRDFIGHTLTDWELAPTYVVLVGDAAWIPVHYYLESLKSDHFYAAASGDDVYPDVALGRLSVTTNDELDIVVSKLIDYDTTPPSGDWKSEILLTAHEGFNEDDVYRKNQEEVRHNLANSTYGALYNVSTAYAGEGNMLQYFIDKMNQGVFFTSYRGHGTPFIWDSANLALNTTTISGLQNGGRLPLVTSLTCSNADVTYPTCVGEAFQRAPDGGSIGFLGATGITFTYPHVDYEKFLYNSTFLDGYYTFGITIFRAKVKTLFKWGSDPSAQENIKMSLFLGDPATRLVKPTMGPRPDLCIAGEGIALSNENPEEGEEVLISLDVENRGSMAISDVTLSLFKGDPDMGGVLIGTMTNSSTLNVNGTWHVQYPWNTSATGGIFKIFVWVDANDSIIELDEENNLGWKEVHVKTTWFSADLQPGWRAISCPLLPLEPSIGPFLNSIDGSYDKVYAYESVGGAIQWRSHIPGRPDGLDGLKSVSNVMGFWVHMNRSATLRVEGINASLGTNIMLYEGWNLVGYPSLKDMSVAQMISEVPDCDAIFGTYEGPAPENLVRLTDSDIFGAGKAYWVHVSEDCYWEVIW